MDVKIDPQKIKKGRNIMFERLDVFSGRLEASPIAWRPSWKAKNKYFVIFNQKI
jgi:hypothetical protein